MDTKALKQDMQEIVKELPAISLVYLFGSRVEGTVGPLSDCDIAIFVEFSAPAETIRSQFQHALETVLHPIPVDVVLLRQAPIELAYAVIAQGVVLYERTITERVEYEAYVMGRYGDYLPVLREQHRDTLQGETNATRVQWYRKAFARTERTLGQIAAATDEISDDFLADPYLRDIVERNLEIVI